LSVSIQTVTDLMMIGLLLKISRVTVNSALDWMLLLMMIKICRFQLWWV